MKNRLIIFLSLFFLLGCSSQKNTTSYSKKQYNEYVSYYNRLKMSTSFDESCDDCSIQLITNKISNKKIRYDIIINNPVIEMKNIKEDSLCCGAGGGVKSAYPQIASELADAKISQAKDTKCKALITACPFCKLNLKGHDLEVLDLTEFLIKYGGE